MAKPTTKTVVGLFAFAAACWALELMPNPRLADGITCAIVGAVYLLGCIVIARDMSFPKRRRILLCSWVGPVIAAVSWYLAFRPLPETASLGRIQFQSVLMMAAIYGGKAAFVTWLFRGYGYLPFLAAGGIFSPKFKTAAHQQAAERPWKWWWVLPVFYLLLGAVAVVFVWRIVYP